MKYAKRTIISVIAILASVVTLFIAPKANATFYEGIDFPQGADSFAELVISNIPGPGVHSPYDDPTLALGIPDATSMSLGLGGTIILSFNESFLVTSGDSVNDLWIFERGTPEPMYVFISTDGIDWISVGEVPGGTSGVDIDSFTGSGVILGREYKYIKLIDKFTSLTGDGADIDAVGASSSKPPEVASYAKSVVSYTPGTGVISPNDDPTRALGVPNTILVSLGLGGTIVMTFDTDLLTTSGDGANDLWIFEKGSYEPTDVFISADGIDWISVGEVPGGTSGVDIDSFIGSGVTSGQEYDYVKLIDKNTGLTIDGADIDAVVASSLLNPTVCIDLDGDGYGSPGNSSCPDGFLTDCDDNNSDVNPGAVESFSEGSTCSDAVDNNCDGVIDTDDSNCKPDLEVTSLSNPPTKRYRGTKFNITDVVTNHRAATNYLADTGNSIVRYYLSKDEFKDSGDKLLKGTRAVPVLIDGETSGGLSPIKVKIPLNTRRGSYYVIACADDTAAINEGNENNNCLRSETKIKIK